MSSKPPYTINVEAQLRADGVWLIRAKLRFREGPPPPESDILGNARLALLGAIAEAGQRGLARGANRCRVVLDTGERVTEFTLGDVSDLGPLN